MSELKSCPFCGGEAKVLVDCEPKGTFEIIGCTKISMLCPNPTMTVYRKDGVFDYTYWNRRVENNN